MFTPEVAWNLSASALMTIFCPASMLAAVWALRPCESTTARVKEPIDPEWGLAAPPMPLSGGITNAVFVSASRMNWGRAESLEKVPAPYWTRVAGLEAIAGVDADPCGVAHAWEPP